MELEQLSFDFLKDVEFVEPIFTDEKIELLQNLEKNVFIYDTSEIDKNIFKNRIVDYLNGKAESTLTETMNQIVWVRNQNGTTLKYKNFNERKQIAYFDRKFWEWCVLVCELISYELHIASEIYNKSNEQHKQSK